MKSLLISLGILMLVGAGCFSVGNLPEEYESPFENPNTYTNTEFGFALDYPETHDVNVRGDDVRSQEYVGIEMEFFASLRDMVREDGTPENIFWMYAKEGLSVEEFTDALVNTGNGHVAISSTETATYNDIEMTKVESTTEVDMPKLHYLFDRNGTTIVLSIFLHENETSLPFLESFRTIE
jgi:hypothetical protein